MSRQLATIVFAVISLLFFVVQPCAARQESMVTVTSKASKPSVAPGDQMAIAVIFDHQPKWHIHTNDPIPTPGMVKSKTPAFPTVIKVKAGGGAKDFAIQWPKSHEVQIDAGEGPERYKAFEGRAIAYVPIQIPQDAKPGTEITVDLAVSFQACDDRNCQLPEDVDSSITLKVVELAAAGSRPDPDFAAFDPSAFAAGAAKSGNAAASKPVKFSAFGFGFTVDAAGSGFVILLLVAAFGGFLLNLTPCVLPVIPLKIMGLSQAAGNPGRCFLLGSVMSLGVVAFWMAIGGAIAFISGFTAINSLFQTPWFSLSVGAFILIMGVGMLGAFAVRLPQVAYMVNPSHETAPGSFVFGVMTAVLSTPCTAPFMGSAAAWAATQNPVVTLATFGAIGAGMALPYFILSAFPKLVSRMPRTGPASELIKQVMGLLMVAVAIFFLGTGIDPLLRLPVDPPIRFYWWLVAALAVVAMAWLVYRTFQITARTGPLALWSVFAVAFAAVSLLVARSFTDHGPIPWIGYTPERLAEQLKNGKTVVLDFTAEWCINCKALEASVLHQPEVVAVMVRNPDVVPMRVDLTGNNVPGKTKLKELGWLGIPLLAIYGPSAPEPFLSDAYTPGMVVDAIHRSRGTAASGPGPSPSVALPR